MVRGVPRPIRTTTRGMGDLAAGRLDVAVPGSGAAEVKELAGQTGRAKEEIGGITDRIREVSRMTSAIAAAVGEQGAATRDSVRGASHAAEGAWRVTATIDGVAGTAGGDWRGCRQSEDLRQGVSRLPECVRAP